MTDVVNSIVSQEIPGDEPMPSPIDRPGGVFLGFFAADIYVLLFAARVDTDAFPQSNALAGPNTYRGC